MYNGRKGEVMRDKIDYITQNIDPDYVLRPHRFMEERITSGDGIALSLRGIDVQSINTGINITKIPQHLLSCSSVKSVQVDAAILCPETVNLFINGIAITQWLWRMCETVPLYDPIFPMSQADGVGCRVSIIEPTSWNKALKTILKQVLLGCQINVWIQDDSTVQGSDIRNQLSLACGELFSAGVIPIINIARPIKTANSSFANASTLIDQFLDTLQTKQNVILSLPLSSDPEDYSAIVNHPNVIRSFTHCQNQYSDPSGTLALVRKNAYLSPTLLGPLIVGINRTDHEGAFERALNKNVDVAYRASQAGKSFL
jgi:hypothetical protein